MRNCIHDRTNGRVSFSSRVDPSFACNDVIFGYPYFLPAGQVFANVTLAYTLPTT